MKIAICYIAVTGGPITGEFCSRFVGSYLSYPPGEEHSTIVVCNGGPLKTTIAMMFNPMNPVFLARKNDEGFDLSGYMEVASGIGKDFDALLCLGESVYFHKEGWLKRFSEAWEKHGPGMYGPLASHNVRAHLNTTAFMCAPSLLLQYPVSRWNRPARYEFEHGTQSLWRRLHSKGFPTMLVTWDGEWPPGRWRQPNDILWRGTQNNLLLFCNHTERWFHAPLQQKQKWSQKADQKFQ